jgi:hypothetical protein
VAAANRPPVRRLSREQRLAALLVERYRLAPPVALERVMRDFADVEDDDVPAGCDGLVLWLHGPRIRPLVILDRAQSVARRRFTLAHELGHILLPWHLGSTLACNTRASLLDAEDHVADAEREANRFAADLLVPPTWLDRKVAGIRDDSVAALMRALADAQVSAHVACLRLLETLPPGHVFAILDRTGRVELSGQTPETRIAPPPRDTALERALLDRFAARVEEIPFGPWLVIWWTYRGSHAEPPDDDPRRSREVLDALMARHAAGLEDERRLRLALSGVIGAANGDARRQGDTAVGSLHARFRGRFAKSRNVPPSMLADPEFELWLRKRAAELAR